MRGLPENTFRPRRIVDVDVATGGVTYPDPGPPPPHALARVLVRWQGTPIGIVEVEEPDARLVDAVRQAAERTLAGELAGARAASRPPDSPGAGPLVTVAIASFRNVASTVECVRQVLESSWTSLDVLVVDNDRDPAELSGALSAAFGHDPRVRWVHEPRQGLSFARNACLATARGAVVAFTDDDVRADPRWVERLVGAFDAAPDVACVAGAILPIELETQAQAWLEEYGGFHKGFRRQVFNTTTHRRNSPLYPYDAGQFGSGANMAFRVDRLRDLGGFAVDLGAGTPAHGGEDLDVTRRVITAGHTIVYEPTALIWHRHRRSEEALRRQMFRYGIGLSATVTKWLLEDRATAVDVLRRLPSGVARLLRPDSGKNSGRSATFPRQLVARELLGVAVGPVAYLRSRRRARRLLAGGRPGGASAVAQAA